MYRLTNQMIINHRLFFTRILMFKKQQNNVKVDFNSCGQSLRDHLTGPKWVESVCNNPTVCVLCPCRRSRCWSQSMTTISWAVMMPLGSAGSVTGPAEWACATGQTCWRTPDAPWPSGTPCSRRRRWTQPWRLPSAKHRPSTSAPIASLRKHALFCKTAIYRSHR